MPTPDQRSAFQALSEEVRQGHSTRRVLYEQIEEALGGEQKKRVLAFFTSFLWPVLISDWDADMIEEALRNMPLDNKELVLIINSPGGDGLAAERIINICRSYSTGGFSVIVPKMAKSAATMICLGAKNIGMSTTSELGPIDPQFPIVNERGEPVAFRAAHEIIESYEDLMRKANRTRGKD